jgi:hypothetical protein
MQKLDYFRRKLAKIITSTPGHPACRVQLFRKKMLLALKVSFVLKYNLSMYKSCLMLSYSKKSVPSRDFFNGSLRDKEKVRECERERKKK